MNPSCMECNADGEWIETECICPSCKQVIAIRAKEMSEEEIQVFKQMWLDAQEDKLPIRLLDGDEG